GLEKLMSERRLIRPEEITAGRALGLPPPVARILSADQVPAILQAGSPTERQPPAPASFGEGDLVRAKNIHPLTHTRLPRYVRGHIGTIEGVRGCHVFPDMSAIGKGEDPQWLYTVAFEGRALWGADSD